MKSAIQKIVALTSLAITAIYLYRPTIAQAQDDSSQFTPNQNIEAIGSGGTANLLFQGTFGFTSLSQAINTIISVIFFGAALAAFVFIVLGAFQYVTAGDDATKTEKSRKTITNAVVGLILVALVYVIFQIVIRIVPGLSQWFGGGVGGY